MYYDRRLQNYMESKIKLQELGSRAVPEKHDGADKKIAEEREMLIQNVRRLYHPAERAVSFCITKCP